MPAAECEYGISDLDFAHAKPWLAFTFSPRNWRFNDRVELARLLVWNYEEDALVFEAETRTSDTRFTQDDRFIVASSLATAEEDEHISVWDTANYFALRGYPGRSPQLHPNSELMVTIGPDGNIWIWDLVEAKLVAILPAILS